MSMLEIPSGTRFGHLVVIREAERKRGKIRQFLCRCDCGNEKTVVLGDLRSGHTSTCGCRSFADARRINVQDYIGRRYGKLVVIGEGEQSKGDRFKVQCRCDCGTVKDYPLLNLENKYMPTRSCGCVRRIHDGIVNRSKEKLYGTYINMKNRCSNANIPGYDNYGGRGIKVCDEWYDSYPAFRTWALDNGYREGLTLDRINNDGDYEPSNCRWVSMKIQSNNTRRNIRIFYNGECHTLKEWSEITGINYHTLSYRYHQKWPVNRMFSA